MKSGDAHAVKACVPQFSLPITVLAISGGSLARQSANSGSKSKASRSTAAGQERAYERDGKIEVVVGCFSKVLRLAFAQSCGVDGQSPVALKNITLKNV